MGSGLAPKRAGQAPQAEDALAIILTPSGAKDAGQIDAEAASALNVPAGPIRLLNGYQGRGGWGWQHLVQVRDRVKAIEALGYPTCQAFVFDVAAHWTELHEANEAGRIKAVLPKNGYELAIVLQWTGQCWSVTTALPFRPAGKRKLYEKNTG